MKDYVILNWKTGELMDSNFNPVNLEKAKIYDDLEYAINEIDCTGEPFCKVIEVSQLKEELQKTKKYNDLRGVDLFSLKYGQKFKILQEGWEGKTFVYQSQKTQPKSDRIWLYEKENHSGNKINISGNIACALKVQVIN